MLESDAAPLSRADFARLGDLHTRSIPGSLPELLGPRYSKSLYRFLASSRQELLLVERLEGQVESACVVSLEPETLFRRLLLGTLPPLVGAGLLGLRRRAFRRYLRSLLKEKLSGGKSSDLPAPAIVYVFTSAESRGSGLGARLLDRAAAAMATQGHEAIYVKTLSDPSNRALAFYEREGYQRRRELLEGGQTFTEFARPLAARETS